MALSEEVYVDTQTQVGLFASMLCGMQNLDQFIAQAERAQALGPILHPSEYRASADKLREVITHARALREARDKIRDS